MMEEPTSPRINQNEHEGLLGVHRVHSPRRRTLIGASEILPQSSTTPRRETTDKPPGFYSEAQNELEELIRKGDRGKIQTLLEDKHYLSALNEPLEKAPHQTLVHLATSIDSQPEMLLVLGLCGADFNIQDSYGWTPLHCLAVRCAHQGASGQTNSHVDRELASQIEKTMMGLKCFEHLLKRESLPLFLNLPNHEKTTPFHYIVSYINPIPKIPSYQNQNQLNKTSTDQLATLYNKILGLCLQRGADINIQNGLGETPLHYAARHENLESICFLLSNNVRVDLLTTGGQESALHYACRVGSVPIILQLLSSSIDINGLDVDGRRPIDHCSRSSPQIKEVVQHELDLAQILRLFLSSLKQNIYPPLLNILNGYILPLKESGDLISRQVDVLSCNIQKIYELCEKLENMTSNSSTISREAWLLLFEISKQWAEYSHLKVSAIRLIHELLDAKKINPKIQKIEEETGFELERSYHMTSEHVASFLSLLEQFRDLEEQNSDRWTQIDKTHKVVIDVIDKAQEKEREVIKEEKQKKEEEKRILAMFPPVEPNETISIENIFLNEPKFLSASFHDDVESDDIDHHVVVDGSGSGSEKGMGSSEVESSTLSSQIPITNEKADEEEEEEEEVEEEEEEELKKKIVVHSKKKISGGDESEEEEEEEKDSSSEESDDGDD